MAYGMKRQTLRRMAEAKLEDAVVLLNNQRPSSAYYLAGYSVEFGLKACIARGIDQETIPDRDFIKDVYTHKLNDLVRLAGLAKDLQDKMKSEQAFAANWAIANEWTEQSRYEAKQISDAQYLIGSLTDEQYGVMQWIRMHW